METDLTKYAIKTLADKWNYRLCGAMSRESRDLIECFARDLGLIAHVLVGEENVIPELDPPDQSLDGLAEENTGEDFLDFILRDVMRESPEEPEDARPASGSCMPVEGPKFEREPWGFPRL